MASAVGRAERLLALALLLVTALLCGPGHGVLVHPARDASGAGAGCAHGTIASSETARAADDSGEQLHLGDGTGEEHGSCLLCALTGAPRAPERLRVSVPAPSTLAIEAPVTDVLRSRAVRAPTSRGPPRAS